MLFDDQSLPEQKATEPAVEPETEPQAEPAPDPGVPVALPPKGRRASAAANVAELKALFEEQEKKRAERDEQRDRELAEYRNQVMALSQRPVVVQAPQPQQREPQGPSLDDLDRQAKEALDRGDFGGYQRFTRQAAAIEAEQRLAPRFQQQQAPQQDFIPPDVQILFHSYPEVGRHPHYKALLGAESMRIQATARGPIDQMTVLRQAFANVDAQLKGERKANGNGHSNGFSQSTAAALTGVPTARSQASNGESTDGQVVLSREEAETARKYGMSKEKYAAHMAELYPGRKLSR